MPPQARLFVGPEHEVRILMNVNGVDLPEEVIADFCRRNHIRRLALFGSILRKDFDRESDIDVLVEFEFGTRVGLRFFALERELSALIGRKVDLNTPGFLGRDFRDEVLASARIQYEAA
jgi:Predicted nucleotidyltransferases